MFEMTNWISGKCNYYYLDTTKDFTVYFIQLLFESSICKILQGGDGFAKFHGFTRIGDYDAMVMDLLGPSLEDYFSARNYSPFTMHTVLMLISGMIGECIRSRAVILLHPLPPIGRVRTPPVVQLRDESAYTPPSPSECNLFCFVMFLEVFLM